MLNFGGVHQDTTAKRGNLPFTNITKPESHGHSATCQWCSPCRCSVSWQSWDLYLQLVKTGGNKKLVCIFQWRGQGMLTHMYYVDFGIKNHMWINDDTCRYTCFSQTIPPLASIIAQLESYQTTCHAGGSKLSLLYTCVRKIKHHLCMLDITQI